MFSNYTGDRQGVLVITGDKTGCLGNHTRCPDNYIGDIQGVLVIQEIYRVS